MKNKKIMSLACITLMCASFLAGCGETEPDAAAIAQAEHEAHIHLLAQNDYRGAYTRIDAIRQSVKEVIEQYQSAGNNSALEKHGTDYWTDENFTYFVTSFISDKSTKYTDLFNEKEVDWETVTSTLYGQLEAEGVTGIAERLGENHYTMEYSATTTEPYLEIPRVIVDRKAEVNYDAGKDWADVVLCTTHRESGIKFYDGMVQYARVGNKFIVQTEKERLIIEYGDPKTQIIETVTKNEDGSETVTSEEVAIDTGDLFEDRQIKNVYYSRLNGKVLPYYVLARESDTYDGEFWGATYGINDDLTSVNADGSRDIACQYNKDRDDIFTHLNDIDKNWVFADGGAYYEQTLVFENQILTVEDLNELSRQIERYIYYPDGMMDYLAYNAPDEFSPYNDIDFETLVGKVTHAEVFIENGEQDVKISALRNEGFGTFSDTIHANLINGEVLGSEGSAWHGHIVYDISKREDGGRGVEDYGSSYNGGYDIWGNNLETTTFRFAPLAGGNNYTPNYGVDFGDISQSIGSSTSTYFTVTRLGSSKDAPALYVRGTQNFNASMMPKNEEMIDEVGYRSLSFSGDMLSQSDLTVLVNGHKVTIISDNLMSNFSYTCNGWMPYEVSHEETYTDEDGKEQTKTVTELDYRVEDVTMEYKDITSITLDFDQIFSVENNKDNRVDTVEEDTTTEQQ